MRRVNNLSATLAVAVACLAAWPVAVGAQRPLEYAPIIKPADFVQGVANPYYPWKPGTTFIYTGMQKGGSSRTVIHVANSTKTILGVTCVVIRDTVWVHGDLIEDTWDWYAQDRQGAVWYFGENSTQLKKGVVLGHAGSWQAGVHGAQPGIVMPARPRVGPPYHQEYWKGIAEDMAAVVNLNGTAVIPYGSFHDLVVTKEWSPIDPAPPEYKYYASGVGFVMMKAEGENEALVSVTHS